MNISREGKRKAASFRNADGAAQTTSLEVEIMPYKAVWIEKTGQKNILCSRMFATQGEAVSFAQNQKGHWIVNKLEYHNPANLTYHWSYVAGSPGAMACWRLMPASSPRVLFLLGAIVVLLAAYGAYTLIKK
jgi:hypothetical protein